MDVSDIIEYNASILSSNGLSDSFFCLTRIDPTVGFPFDARKLAGHTYPETSNDTLGKLLITLGHRIRCGVVAAVLLRRF